MRLWVCASFMHSNWCLLVIRLGAAVSMNGRSFLRMLNRVMVLYLRFPVVRSADSAIFRLMGVRRVWVWVLSLVISLVGFVLGRACVNLLVSLVNVVYDL